MRYGYDNLAVSLVNRVYNAAFNSLPNAADFYQSEGVSPLAAAMWWQADLRMDWGGETDVICEEYPAIDRIYSEVIVNLPHWDGPAEGTRRNELWDVYDEATDLTTNLENRIFLAALVVNALRSLEGDVQLIWQQNDGGATQRYNDEFKLAREAMDLKVRGMFAKWVARKHSEQFDPNRAKIAEILLKSNDQILAEREAERLRLFNK